ncbi:response regulator [Hellea balneolensis]|uniref:hypothetical protein n=1 Tax=Hellea balneolensis TaxID=287478 RepID=UPI00041BEE28|nr:hypothetical protein [Hellea balneolensis]
MKLLLIDDDAIEHKILNCYITAGIGGPVMLTSALDIDTAKAALGSETYDYIFLDDRFTPFKNALETLPLLKPLCGKAKIIIISSCISSQHLKSAEDLGVTAIMNKSDVRDYVSERLNRRKHKTGDAQHAA